MYVVLEVPSQFSMGQTVQSLTCSIWRNHIQGWMTDLNMLLSCFREKMSADQWPKGGWAFMFSLPISASIEVEFCG